VLVNLRKPLIDMKKPSTLHFNMRIIHRYLGFFLAGIMTVYAFSGMVLVYRDTDFLKQEQVISKQIQANAPAAQLSELLDIRRLRVEREDGDIIYFENGTYENATGQVEYTVKQLPYLLEKMTGFHKAKSGEPLHFLNLFFGFSLFFFAVSSFWMFMPATPVFRKGLYFALAGVVLALVLLFV
jgi:uncharacterized iron-regulated membrane protein